MAWLFLILGGILEVGWALGLSFSDGFSKIEIVIPTVILMIGSFYFLQNPLKCFLYQPHMRCLPDLVHLEPQLWE